MGGVVDLRLTLVADISDHLQGAVPAAISVGPDGEAICLAVEKVDLEPLSARHVSPAGASFPKTQSDRPYNAAVILHDGERVSRLLLEDVATSFPLIQPLPNGQILLVGRRCGLLADGTGERNARVYGADGRLRRDFCLGDGIQDVQTTHDGGIWVSYFDEGVFGNAGWRGIAGPESAAAAGLGRFDDSGVVQWSYQPPSGVGEIDDCHALNVAQDAVWAYYYSDFPLVRIKPSGEIHAWRTSVEGARATAIWQDHVLFYGGYAEERRRCTLWRLGNRKLKSARQLRLTLPTGNEFEGERVIGRGPVLHAFAGPAWYQADLRKITG